MTKIDADLEALAFFMEGNFAASKLVPLAKAISKLAPILWGQHGREDFTPLELCAPIPSAERTPTVSNQ